MYVWYPGRPPECTPELLGHLTELLDQLDLLIEHRDGTYIEQVNTLCDTMLELVEQEQQRHPDTDTSLQMLQHFYIQLPEAVQLVYENHDWDEMFVLAVGVTDVRDSLGEDLAETQCSTSEAPCAAL